MLSVCAIVSPASHCTVPNDLDKSRNLSIFIFASLIPFFRLLTPFLCFYRWILRQNVAYMKKVPWFFKLQFWTELCRGPGPAGLSHRNTETGTHTHTSHHHQWRLCCKNKHQFSAQSMQRFPKTDSNQCKHKRQWPPPAWCLKCYCQAAHHWAPSLSLILTDSC